MSNSNTFNVEYNDVEDSLYLYMSKKNKSKFPTEYVSDQYGMVYHIKESKYNTNNTVIIHNKYNTPITRPSNQLILKNIEINTNYIVDTVNFEIIKSDYDTISKNYYKYDLLKYLRGKILSDKFGFITICDDNNMNINLKYSSIKYKYYSYDNIYYLFKSNPIYGRLDDISEIIFINKNDYIINENNSKSCQSIHRKNISEKEREKRMEELRKTYSNVYDTPSIPIENKPIINNKKEKEIKPTSNDNIFNENRKSFVELGIGGLDDQFNDIIKRIFTTRIAKDFTKDLDIKHVKGLVLYGPPGCGKTLVARKLSEIVNSKKVKIVNGPELLDSYVGNSEKNVRELFAEAKNDFELYGDDAELHTIIIDEMDSLFRKRGLSNNTTSDNIVNQFLTELDGVNEIKNILVIGMTNRIDLIDPAVMRTGRLEVKLEIKLPDEKGREQILRIKLDNLIKTNKIEHKVIEYIPELAKKTTGFSGSDLEGLVKNAISDTIYSNLNKNDLSIKKKEFKVSLASIKASEEFFMKNKISNHLESLLIPYEWYKFNASEDIMIKIDYNIRSISKLHGITKTILIDGEHGCGKSSTISKYMLDNNTRIFGKRLSGHNFCGQTESSRIAIIQSSILEITQNKIGILFIDDFDICIEYSNNKFMTSVYNYIRTVSSSPNIICNLLIILSCSENIDNNLLKFIDTKYTHGLVESDECEKICKQITFNDKEYKNNMSIKDLELDVWN